MATWSRKSIPFLLLFTAVTAWGMTKTQNKRSAQGTVFSKQKKGTLGGIRRNLNWTGPLCDQVTLIAGEGHYDAATKTGAWAEQGKRVVGSKGHAKADVTLFSLEGQSKTCSSGNSSAGIKWQAGADIGIGAGYETTAGRSGFTAKLEAGASARASLGAKMELTTSIDGVEVKGTIGVGAAAGWAASVEAVLQADWDPTTDKKTRISFKYGASNVLGFYSELELEVDTSSLVNSILHGDGLSAWAEWLKERQVPARGIRWMLQALKAMAKKAETMLEEEENAKDMPTKVADGTSEMSEASDSPSAKASSSEDAIPSASAEDLTSQDQEPLEPLSLSARPHDAQPEQDSAPSHDANPTN